MEYSRKSEPGRDETGHPPDGSDGNYEKKESGTTVIRRVKGIRQNFAESTIKRRRLA